MYSTGYPSSRGSYSGSLLWSGGVYLALLRPTCKIFAVPSWAPEVHVPSALWNGGPLCPFCMYFHKADPCILGGRSFHVEWTPMAQRLLHSALSDTFYSSQKTVPFRPLSRPRNCPAAGLTQIAA